MKCIVRVLVMLTCLMIGATEKRDDDEISATNLQKLKRAAVRRNQPQKVPSFGWGKRGAGDIVDDLIYRENGELLVPEKKHSFYPEHLFNAQPQWNIGPPSEKLRKNWNSVVPGKSASDRDCVWYSCRVERSGWDSQYGKRADRDLEDESMINAKSAEAKTDEARELQHAGLAADKNGWGSGYGRSVERNRLEAITRARRLLADDDDSVVRRQANRNGWNSAYGRRRR